VRFCGFFFFVQVVFIIGLSGAIQNHGDAYCQFYSPQPRLSLGIVSLQTLPHDNARMILLLLFSSPLDHNTHPFSTFDSIIGLYKIIFHGQVGIAR